MRPPGILKGLLLAFGLLALLFVFADVFSTWPVLTWHLLPTVLVHALLLTLVVAVWAHMMVREDGDGASGAAHR